MRRMHRICVRLLCFHPLSPEALEIWSGAWSHCCSLSLHHVQKQLERLLLRRRLLKEQVVTRRGGKSPRSLLSLLALALGQVQECEAKGKPLLMSSQMYTSQIFAKLANIKPSNWHNLDQISPVWFLRLAVEICSLVRIETSLVLGRLSWWATEAMAGESFRVSLRRAAYRGPAWGVFSPHSSKEVTIRQRSQSLPLCTLHLTCIQADLPAGHQTRTWMPCLVPVFLTLQSTFHMIIPREPHDSPSRWTALGSSVFTVKPGKIGLLADWAYPSWQKGQEVRKAADPGLVALGPVLLPDFQAVGSCGGKQAAPQAT